MYVCVLRTTCVAGPHIPAGIDLIGMDGYSPSINASDEVSHVKRMYGDLWPMLLPHQAAMVVPGMVGCSINSTIGRQIGDRANSQVLLDKLTLYYSHWAKAEPRIGGFAPWHYSDYRVNPDCGVPTCPGPERACDWKFGASHYPAVVSRLQQIGRSILMRPVPHKSDDNEAGGEGPPATTALAHGGITITPVFSRGEGGCSAYRIPGIQSLNGTLLVFAECRKYDCGDFGGQHNIAFKRSTDGGASFSEVQTLLDPMVMFSAEQCPTDAASVRSQNSSCVFWDPVCYCPSRCGLTNSRD
jgi:hypothetical protein